jgi:Holliday junction resolvase RusA-like endonuclease
MKTALNNFTPSFDYNAGDWTLCESIELVILGEPKAQKRHRHVKMGNFVRQYDPSAADKGDFLSIIQSNAPEKPYDSPLKVDILFYFARPKSHYGTGSKAEVIKANAPQWHLSKPDVDNCIKFVMDSMNKIYWRDDSIICDCSIKKMYSTNPRTEIIITKL